ncbi:MAG: ketosteroid isomerase-like protein [Myxococcota bacterium]|jgi:ketosteroid isomerase-like protein
MSLAPIEVVEALYEALARGDVEAAGALLHPAVRWIEQRGFPGGAEHRGRPAVETLLFRDRQERWALLQARTDSLHEDGDLVFVRGAYIARPQGIPREVVVPFVHIYEVRGGLIEACHLLTDTALLRDALEGRI